MGRWTVEETLASSVLSSSPLATIVLDQDRRVRGFNPAAEQVTGRTADELVGEHVSVLFPPDEVSASLELLEAAATGDAGHIELELRGGDGDVVPIGVSWAPLVHGGETIGLVGVGRDISRRKALEHERATMANSFRGLAEGSGLGMYRFAFGPQLCVDYVNPHFESIFGVTLAELAVDPSPLWDRLDSHARQQLDRARRGEDVVWPIDARWHHPSGRTLDCQLHEVQLRAVSGRLEWVLGVVRDVTGQRRQQRALASALELERAAADRLRRVDELRQLFLQAVSHELRTPLTAILGFGATLRDRAGVLPPDAVSGLADRIHRQGERMQRLLDDLLDVDRLSRGALHLERAPTDLAALVRRVQGERGDDAVEVVAPPCTIDVDAPKIERIVDNLLSNARRHAGTTARVRVTIEPGDPVRIVVEDDGPGVPEQLRATVFEPFEQGTTAGGAPSPGTGIGLTLVSAFAELHGGHASVDVSRLGGARFVVELPVSGDCPRTDGR